MKIPILFEDEFIVAVDKPTGLLSQASVDPRRPHLPQLLSEQLGQKIYSHHRLDKETSGVMIFSKSVEANPGLTELFREHQIQKTYVALTKKAAHNQMAWTVKNFLAPTKKTNRQPMRMLAVKSGGAVAETAFHILTEFKEALYVEAQPKTGRTHQIRVHLAEDQRPILGDSLYGGNSSLVPRLMLHAKKLELKHPVTQENFVFEAELPKDFESVLKAHSRYS